MCPGFITQETQDHNDYVCNWRSPMLIFLNHTVTGKTEVPNPEYWISGPDKFKIWNIGILLCFGGGQDRNIHGSVRHAETSPKVFRDQHDSVFVLLRILLNEVLHGFHEKPLSFQITRIGASLL